MTTEDDFQAAIDARPEDWQARLNLADWLAARNDPRAPGYRALAVQERRPLQGQKLHNGRMVETWWWSCPSKEGNLPAMYNQLPRDWFNLLPAEEGNKPFWPLHTEASGLKSRRECEDAAALAFAGLPEARRTELLTTPGAQRGRK
jgi:uncharacterized protein (TIGR02996 family)